MKKQLSLILAVLLAASSFVSCGETSGDPAGTSAPVSEGSETTPAETVPEETETELSDDIEPMSFDGASFTVLTSANNVQHTITAIHEVTGDALNDAMYYRTQKIMEKYNIEFTEDYAAKDSGTAMTVFTNSHSAGDQAYDLAMHLDRRAFAAAAEGYFTDISTLEYVNLDKPYWLKDVNDVINFTDATYLSYGAATLCIYDMTHVLCFNQELISRCQLENPYRLVLDNKWTIDKLKTMGEAAMLDENGDGVWGDEDIFGIVGAVNALPMNFLASTRNRTIENDREGNVEICLLTNPMIEDVFTRVSDMCWQTGFWYTKTTDSNTYWQKEPHFQENRALFADHTFYSTISLRGMDADFGIIPFPKYDENQQEYGAMVEAGTRTMTVPANVKNYELCGAVLETLHFLSLQEVMPAYYEVTLKGKVSRDEESAMMLDIIMDSIFFDLGMTMFNDTVKDGIFSPQFKNNQRQYASAVAGKMQAIEAAIAAAKGEKAE
ncbi:MAG: extracellular solute-binding protein [Clostridia bacterium]|nr:extracellular solute-binding protein [Clostridia bacterium]